MRAVDHYLQRYAEAEVRTLDTLPVNFRFERCIVLPVYNETTNWVTRFQASHLAENTLLIVIKIVFFTISYRPHSRT